MPHHAAGWNFEIVLHDCGIPALVGGGPQPQPVGQLFVGQLRHGGLVQVDRRAPRHIAGAAGDEDDLRPERIEPRPWHQDFLPEQAIVAFVDFGFDSFAGQKHFDQLAKLDRGRPAQDRQTHAFAPRSAFAAR